MRDKKPGVLFARPVGRAGAARRSTAATKPKSSLAVFSPFRGAVWRGSLSATTLELRPRHFGTTVDWSIQTRCDAACPEAYQLRHAR
jgi:hypothetical protein